MHNSHRRVVSLRLQSGAAVQKQSAHFLVWASLLRVLKVESKNVQRRCESTRLIHSNMPKLSAIVNIKRVLTCPRVSATTRAQRLQSSLSGKYWVRGGRPPRNSACILGAATIRHTVPMSKTIRLLARERLGLSKPTSLLADQPNSQCYDVRSEGNMF
jgi:hypothetical protein